MYKRRFQLTTEPLSSIVRAYFLNRYQVVLGLKLNIFNGYRYEKNISTK
jgi:hypothetical protein